jgi:hypothetical protein
MLINPVIPISRQAAALGRATPFFGGNLFAYVYAQ